MALVTLFHDNGDLDARATADLALELVELGARAMVVAGTTGEAAALEPEERSELVAAVRQVLPAGGVPLVVGVGAASARQACRLAASARDGGADALLALSPPRVDDPGSYYAAVAEVAGALPLFAYHYPAVSPPGISIDALSALPVNALKDSSGDAGRLAEILDVWDRPVYVGSSSILTLAGALGCPGAVLALANVAPEICQAAFEGDAGAQLKLAKYRSAQSNFPQGLKQLVAERFGCSARARLGSGALA